MSSILQASYKSWATAAKMRSLRIQRAIKLCERIKIQRETTVLRSSIKSGRSWASIAGKLLKIFLRLSKITEMGRNTTVPRVTTSHSIWMVRWMQTHMACAVQCGVITKMKPRLIWLINVCLDVWTIFAQAVCNSYTSGCYATCVLHWYFSRDTNHTVLPKLKA